MKKLLLASVLALANFANLAWAETFQWPSQTWLHQDTGLYWVTSGNIYCPATPSQEAPADSRCPANAYDPQKPTIIFIHGWEPMTTYLQYRPDFYLPAPANSNIPATLSTHDRQDIQDWDTASAWRKKGWNVAVFYWNQLADTDSAYQAEAKIYSLFGPERMSWWGYRDAYRNPQGQTTYEGYQQFTNCNINGHACMDVQDLLDADVIAALQNFQGSELRIAGHSLGSQLAIGLSYDLALQVEQGQLSPNYIPRQLVLLDPFFTAFDSSYYPWLFGKTPEQVVAPKVEHLISQDGVIVSEYLSSDLTESFIKGPLSHETAMTWYEPHFDWWFDQMDRHSAAYFMYYLSEKDAPPPASATNSSNQPFSESGGAASASTSEMRLAQMMGGHYYWDQTAGTLNINTAYDAFTRHVLHQNFYPVDSLQVFLQNQDQPIAPNAVIKTTEDTWLKFAAVVAPQKASNKIVLWQSDQPQFAEVFPGGYVHVLSNTPAGTLIKITAIAPGGILDAQGEPQALALSFYLKV